MSINADNYVDTAEQVIQRLKNKVDKNRRTVPMVTTSKLRNLLAMTADIYNEIMNRNETELSKEVCAKIEYLRVRFIYESGREPSVRSFVTEAGILESLKMVGKSREQFVLFNRYMEALVAFHKFYGGKDN